MTEKTWPIAIRYYLRDRPALDVDYEAYWNTYGFAFRDGEGEEHHFGFPERAAGRVIFTFIASYTDAGRDTAWPGGVHDKLVERGYELVDPERGPALSPLVVIALDHLADFARDNGFAFDAERKRAVHTFAALRQVGERFDPDEVYVWSATSGFRPKDAKGLKEYARRALDGSGTRTVNGHAIKLDREEAEMMVAGWREELEGGSEELEGGSDGRTASGRLDDGG